MLFDELLLNKYYLNELNRLANVIFEGFVYRYLWNFKQWLRTKNHSSPNPVMSANVLFSDLFRVESLNPGKYDRVSRIEAQSTAHPDLQLSLDINTELYQVQKGETITVSIASSLGEQNPSRSWRPPRAGETSLADEYDYVMFGKVYKFTEDEKGEKDKLVLYASFGGLLLSLEGNYSHLSPLKQEQIYLLIRR